MHKKEDKKNDDFLKRVVSPFFSSVDNLSRHNSLLKFLFIFLVVGQFYVGYQIDTKIASKETIVLPPNQPVGFSIKANSADDAYYSKMGVMISDLYFDINASNAEEKLAILLTYFRSDRQPTYQKKFKEKIEFLRSLNNVSFSASKDSEKPLKITDDNFMEIPVRLTKQIGDTKKPSTIVYLRIDFQLSNSRFEIIDIREFSYE